MIVFLEGFFCCFAAIFALLMMVAQSWTALPWAGVSVWLALEAHYDVRRKDTKRK